MLNEIKSTGIVRKLDDLGRIVLPKEMRTVLGIAERDMLEIYVDKNQIILQKYVPDSPSCIFCQSESGITSFKSKAVCKACASEIRSQK